MRYARIRFVDRPAPQNIFYATEGFQQQPKGEGKGDNFAIPWAWANEEKRLQTSQAWSIQYTPRVWLVNVADGSREEYITTAGNVVSFYGITDNHIQVRAFNPYEDPAGVIGLENMSYLTQPDLFHKVTAMSHDGKVYNPGPNLDMYHIITTNGENWQDDVGVIHSPQAFMSLNQVELFPGLPMPVTIKVLSLRVRSSYSTAAPQVGSYYYGQKPTIYDYRPRGSDVWGRTDLGWICLQQNRSFYTDWYMQTPPPIPPAA